MVRCSVHLLAVSATTSIAYFNLAGFFIGSEFQGLTGGVYQALDTLCLQVTAKLLVTVSGLKICRQLRYLFVTGIADRRVFGNNSYGHFAPPFAIRS